jgi:YD repeat-containing protein
VAELVIPILDPDIAARSYLPRNPELTVAYNSTGNVASVTENGLVTTFTYNIDGTVKTQTTGGITKTFSYDTNGRVTGAI